MSLQSNFLTLEVLPWMIRAQSERGWGRGAAGSAQGSEGLSHGLGEDPKEVVVMAVVAPEARPRERAALRPHRAETRRAVDDGTCRSGSRSNVVVGLVAALLAFVLAGVAVGDRREMMTVAVARDRIPAGTPSRRRS